MVHQFEAEKCLHGALTGLGTLILCNRFDPRGTPGNLDGTNPGTRAESWGNPGGCPGGMLVLGID